MLTNKIQKDQTEKPRVIIAGVKTYVFSQKAVHIIIHINESADTITERKRQSPEKKSGYHTDDKNRVQIKNRPP